MWQAQPVKGNIGSSDNEYQEGVPDLAATDPLGDDLLLQAAAWADSRNQALHAVAKSGQGHGPKVSATEFNEFALAAALDGQALMKRTKMWHQKLVRQALRSEA